MHLHGDLSGAHRPWPALPPTLADAGPVRIDAHALQVWDATVAAELWALQTQLQRRGMHLDLAGMPASLTDVLWLAGAGDGAAGQAAMTPARRARGGALQQAKLTVAFFGEVLLAGRLLRGRSRLRCGRPARQLDQAGPRSCPS